MLDTALKVLHYSIQCISVHPLVNAISSPLAQSQSIVIFSDFPLFSLAFPILLVFAFAAFAVE